MVILTESGEPRGCRAVSVRVFENAECLAEDMVGHITRIVSHHRNEGIPAVLGLAAGASSRALYEALVRYRTEVRFSFSNCHTFTLDEYYPMAPTSEKSFYREIGETLEQLEIPVENRHMLKGDVPPEEIERYCREYEAEIARVHGIDFQILGIGQNGHIAFNEPGSNVEGRTRRVALTERTRRDASGRFEGEENVPRFALTMGIATILEAREIALVAIGKHKAAVIRRLLASPPDLGLPASFLKLHGALTIYLDKDAARMVPQYDDIISSQ